MGSRRLSLHISALTDDEYAQYTPVLNDLAPDGEQVISVREARAWLRGRHPDAPVDEILRLFSPTMKAGDTMSTGQFYAAMRLLTHAQTQGNGVDKALAFVQPQPSPSNTSPNSSQFHQHQAAPFPTPPKSSASSSSTNPFAQSQHRSHNPFASLSRPGSASPTRRPISPPLPSPSRQPAPPIHPSSRSAPGRMSFSLPPPRSGSTSPSKEAPVLPPRKPQLSAPPPPRRPPVPPPKPKTHLTPLMQQSLQASKTGSAMKRAEESLEKARVMQVLKSSSGHVVAAPTHRAGSTSSGSTSGSERYPLPSPPMSISSLEQVALAKPKPAAPPPRHPALSEDGATTPKPPRHPALSDDGSASASRGSGTLGRSKSVHHHSPPSVTGRRRPESVQILMGEMNGLGLSRHASLPLGPQIQKRLGKLMRPQGEDREALMEDERRGKGDWAARGQFDWDGDQTPTVEMERDNLKWPVEDEEGWRRL